MPVTGPEQRQVLIIGWGFLGAAIGNKLLADGLRVTGLTRSATSRTEASRRAGARIVLGDARRPDVLEDALSDVDHVVYCAGGVTPPTAAADPPRAAAEMLPPLLAVNEALSKRPHVALTYLSTSAVYGGPDRLPVVETDPALPISPYGALHLSAELCTQAYARRFGSPLNILRCANVYGPGQAYESDQGVIAIFLDRITRVLPVSIFGDGLALRDYVLVDDVTSVVARIIEDRVDVGTVNVGSGEGRHVLEIVDAISRTVGTSAVVDHRRSRGFEVGSVVLDIRRLSSLMPYTPTSFHRGLDMTAADYSRRRRLEVDHVGAPKT